jgi:DNA polymerase-3 subunit alpha
MFVPEDDGIRFGIYTIPQNGVSSQIIFDERRQTGFFESFYDFYNRAGRFLDSGTLERLIWTGSLDAFGSRKGLVNAVSVYAEKIKKLDDIKEEISSIEKQFVTETSTPKLEQLFREIKVKRELCEILKDDMFSVSCYTPSNDELYNLKKEKEFAKVYLSGHPADHITDDITVSKLVMPNERKERKNQVSGIVTNLIEFNTKHGDKMARFNLEDKTASIDCVIFPGKYQEFKSILEDTKPVTITFHTNKYNEKISYCVDKVTPAKTHYPIIWFEAGSDEEMENIIQILRKYKVEGKNGHEYRIYRSDFLENPKVSPVYGNKYLVSSKIKNEPAAMETEEY